MRGFIVAFIGTLATTSVLQVPPSVRVGHQVTVYASGRVAKAVRNGGSVVLEIQPTVNRGGNGFGAAPKFRAVVVGSRVRVEFRWPTHYDACAGAFKCVRIPWQIGSRVDIDVCAQNRMGGEEGCARGTTVVRAAGVPPAPPAPPCSTSCGDQGMGGPAPTCTDHSITLPGGVTVQSSCFHVDSDGRLTASGHIRVNGLDLVINGSGRFTLSTRQLTLTAGADVDAYAGSLHIYHGPLDWNFQRKLSLGVPPNFKIKGLPVDGDITLSLAPGGVDAVANATIGESSFQVSGTIDLRLTLQSGLDLNSFKLDLSSDVPIRSLIVQKAELSYSHTSSGDVWSGDVAVQLPAGPVVDGTLTVTNGSISEVGATVSGINKPLGEVIFLQSLGLNVVFVPHLSATGSIGLSAGPAIDGRTAASLDGSLTAQITDPFVLSARGTLSLVDQQVTNASVTATIPGDVTFNGSVGRSFGPIAVNGTVDGSITPSSFDAEGGVTAQVGPISATGDALVNNVGIAGCATAKVFWATLSIGGAHRWSGANSVFHDSCDFGRLKSALGAHASAAGGPQAVIRVPPHTRQVNIIVSGANGPPQVQLTHGTGRAIMVPNSEGRLGRMVYLAIADPADSETDIAIGDPGSGAIGIGPAPGQSALTGVASSLPLPNPDVRVSLHRLGGRAYQLSWSARAIPGQLLVFQDRDATGVKQLIETRRAHGTLRFTALDNGARGRHTLRVLVEQNGLLRAAFPGARFQPATLRLAAPRVSVRVKRGNAVITWSSVRNAARYEVSVTTSDGRHLFFAFGAHDRSLRVRSAARISVRVWALGPGGERGRPGTTSRQSKSARH